VRVLLLLALLAVPASVEAQTIFHLSEAVAITGHASDLAATQHCLGAGRCHELNPFLARYDNPVAFSVAKFSVVSLQLWAVRKLRPTHPKLAVAANVAIGSGFLALGVRNQRVSR
jgi:hypothetical protein